MKARTFRILWSAAAAPVILTGVAQSVPAQGTAIISATVRKAVTGNPVADATIRVLPSSRSACTVLHEPILRLFPKEKARGAAPHGSLLRAQPMTGNIYSTSDGGNDDA